MYVMATTETTEPVESNDGRIGTHDGEPVYFTKHVVGPGPDNDRWDERTPWWSVSPEKAFANAITVTDFHHDVFSLQNAQEADAVRYYQGRSEHGEHGILFMLLYDYVEECYRVVTVLDREMIDWSPIRAHLRELGEVVNPSSEA